MRISASCLQAASLATLLGLAAASQSAIAADPADPAGPETNVETVVVTAEQNFRPGALKADIVKTEAVSAEQIERVHAINVNQALDKHPGIAVQVECSICNVRNITLDNLPGRFTTLSIDGVPLFSSLSSAYGLDSVNVRGVSSIDVARGAGASLISPEALSGLVNIVTKVPEEFELQADASAGEHNMQSANVYIASPIDDHWAAALSGSFDKQSHSDANGNGVSEYTGYTRYMAGLALFADYGTTHSKLRFDYINEKRGGGSMNGDYNVTRSDSSGNPFDWSAGKHGSASADGWYAPDGSGFIAYDDGAGGMSEIIFTKRASVLGNTEGKFSDHLDWRVAYGYARNNQHSFYELTRYNANGNQVYSEASLRYHKDSLMLTLGANYRYEDLGSLSWTPDGTEVHGLDNYVYRTPGAFVQAYDTFFDDQLEVNASMRYDHNSTFGTIWTPRLNLLWHHTANLSSRLSLGRGFRAPTSFFEQDHGILDTTKIVREIDDPEISNNLSYSVNYSDDRLSATVSYNFNEIHHFALLDSSATDADNNSITLFTQSDSPVIVQGIDGTIGYQLLPSLNVSVGGERYFYSFAAGTLAFSKPDWKTYFTADYNPGALDLFARVTVTGPQDLKRFYDYKNTQRYNFDGSKKMNESPIFATVDVKASYHLNDSWTLYIGADNLFNYNQAKHEDPLWIDAEGNYDVTQIWGPLLGRQIYGGITLSL